MPTSRFFGFPLLALFLLTVLGGCSKQGQKLRHLARADGYYSAGNFDASEIEYLNVLRLDPRNPQAMARLGMMYFDQGRVGKSLPFLLAAKQLQPDNLDLRLKIGLYDLAFGRFQAARDEALYILDRKPDHTEAPLLLAQSATTTGEIDDLRRRLQSLPAAVAQKSPVLVALGTLEFRTRHFQEAESLCRQALQADPKSSAAWTALAALYWQEKDMPKAEEAFAKASDFAPVRSGKRLQYAQFKIQTGDINAARAMLNELTQKAPDFLPASMLLAQLDESQKHFGDSADEVAKVLERDPANPDALVLSGRLKVEIGEPEKAVAELERAHSLYPQYPQMDYELGQAYLAVGATEKAVNSFSHAVLAAPDYAEAVIALAQISIQAGNVGSAIINLQELVQRRPDSSPARLLLARAYSAQGNWDDALAIYNDAAAKSPGDPQPVVEAGAVLFKQGKLEDARKAFEKALKIAPDNITALEQWVGLELRQKNYSAAERRIDAEIARRPGIGALHLIRARVFLVQKSWQPAEAALQRAIQLDPGSPTGYFLLGELYYTTQQDEKALVGLHQAAAKNPRDTQAMMLIGTISEREKNYPAARAAYESVLAIDPNFSPAVNNLAYLYSENFGLLDKAFEMAQKARKLLPNDPNAADTLGWVLYRRHQYPWALSLLRESVGALSASAENQYHLGMTEYVMGEDAAAKAALSQAVQLDPAFAGNTEARQRLRILAIDTARAAPGDVAFLEKIAVDQPGDPVVLEKLAAIYEGKGQTDRAIASCKAALVANPKDPAASIRLARLYSAQGDLTQAFEYAKSAHNFLPQDPAVSHLVGTLAYRSGDYRWSLSLLEEAAGQRPSDAELQFDYALAAYSLGQVSKAEDAARSALSSNGKFSRAAEASRFLTLLSIAESPHSALGSLSLSDLNGILQSKPDDVPALMAHAAMTADQGDLHGASQDYEKALQVFPDFAPAQRRLVLAYAAMPADAAQATKQLLLVTKAQQSFPSDLQIAKAGGIIAYRSGDYRRAVSILANADLQKADSEATFYLGMAQYHLNNRLSKSTLERAISLNLPADLAARARQTLADLK